MNIRRISDHIFPRVFEVIHSHLLRELQDPEGYHQNLKFGVTLISLVGLFALGPSFFNQNSNELQQLSDSWPGIIKWKRAVFRSRQYHGQEDIFFLIIPQLYTMVGEVCASLLRDKDTFSFAIDIWKGQRVAGDDHHRFAGEPLIECIRLDLPGPGINGEAEHLWNAFNRDEYKMVDMAISRLRLAMNSTPRQLDVIACHLFLLWRFNRFEDHPIAEAVQISGAVECSIDVCRALLDDGDQTVEYLYAIQLTFDLIAYVLQCGPYYLANDVFHARILPLILKAAAITHPEDDPKFLQSQRNLLQELLTSLVYQDNVLTASLHMCSLGKSGVESVDIEQLLQNASDEFRKDWRSFESVLLEQMIILQLIESGYTIESGACMNVRNLCNGHLALILTCFCCDVKSSCDQKTCRKEFKKCAGCRLALYCSKLCQRRDWKRHKLDCEKMDDICCMCQFD